MKKLKLHHIREFLVLSQYKNYNVAAEHLFMSQPTLSRHIKEMEGELGVSLFERSTRRVELTECGAFLVPYAKRIVSAEDQYMEGIASRRKALDRD